MVTLRACTAVAVLVTALMLSPAAAHAAGLYYKLGDVATEDVVTPVPLLVVNPEATEALKQKVAQQVNFVVRHSPEGAVEAEAELRQSIAVARGNFLTNLQPTDLEPANLARRIREAAREMPKDLPIDRLAPLWVRGISDEALVQSLVQPVREVMAQPIVGNKTDAPLPANQPVRVLTVQSLNTPPTPQELANPGLVVTSGKVISLWRAKRLVETHFSSGQESFGAFAASFVRSNAVPDPALTEILRAKRMEGVTVNDTYEAAQVIVRKGQAIDRRALGALAAMREKSLIGTLQTKLEQQQSVAGQITTQTKWIVAGLAVVGAGLIVILWRLRPRTSTALVTVGATPGLPGTAARALPGGDDAWRERALVAEGKAERAHAAIRSGVLVWMREKIFQTLFRQRAELLSAQQKAEAEMRELDQRLQQLHAPLQERIAAYEKRIAELENDLAAKGEENRELIGARISVARQQLLVERERGRFGIN